MGWVHVTGGGACDRRWEHVAGKERGQTPPLL